nr:uncharacterized protein LOC128703655 [Cherax quadricarinatus]
MHQEVGTENSVPCLRVNHYPPVLSTLPEGTTTCFSAHTDYTTFTFIFQDNMGGLQVCDQDGKWLDAEPIPGTILILAGDFLKCYSDNKVVAAEALEENYDNISIRPGSDSNYDKARNLQ